MRTENATTAPVQAREARPGARARELLEAIQRLFLPRTRAPSGVLRLLADRTLSFHPRPGRPRIVCRAGACLVTQERDPADHVLGSGQSLRPARTGRVAIWALVDSEIAIVEDGEAA
jgi:hypothetical protein